MPLATRPNQTYRIILSTDLDLPAGEQPVFLFRYVDCIEWEKIAKLNDEFDTTRDSSKMLAMAFEVIKKVLVGWQNMKMPDGKGIAFNFEKLRSMVSLQEATELMMAAVAQRPNFEDKKKLDLPATSDTAGGAHTPEKSAAIPQSANTGPAEEK